MDGYNENNLAKAQVLIIKALEQFYSFLYLENAEQDKYRPILKSLNYQKSLGVDQYAKTILEALNVMSSQKNYNPRNQNPKNENNPTLLFLQLEGKCYCCRKQWRKSPDCRNKEEIPQDKWAINKTQLVMTKDPTNSEVLSITGSTHHQINQKLDGQEPTACLHKEKIFMSLIFWTAIPPTPYFVTGTTSETLCILLPASMKNAWTKSLRNPGIC